MNLDHLLQRADIWRGSEQSTRMPAISTGFAELDAVFPGGGWPQGALTELLVPREGIGALQLLLPALARLSQQQRWIAWVAPPYIPYAPALAAAGVDLSRILLIHPRAGGDGLWAIEQSLRSGTCGAVLAWPVVGDGKVLRRLQLAAEAGQSLGILFRPEQVAERPSPAALRVQISRRHDGVAVQVLKRRGGWAAGPVPLSLDQLLRQTPEPCLS